MKEGSFLLLLSCEMNHSKATIAFQFEDMTANKGIKIKDTGMHGNIKHHRGPSELFP